ncbi:unnamed protein product [Orchesella dallaii]|uniref:LSM domain-containing protein n=1 Tax=Orchesella dallaii TaxID=48710 RepID=A0ABP1RUZ1_9HEXA
MSNNDETEEFKKCVPVPIPSPVESTSSDVSEVVLWSASSSSSSSDDTLELDSTAKSLLDFSSPTFSPTLALACSSSDVVPVVPGSKKYLNLQLYSKAVHSPSKSPRKDVLSLKQKTVKELEAHAKSKSITELSKTTSTSSTSTPHFPIPGRRFLPHQLPVYRPRKEHPNTLTLMDTVEGPLSVLRRVMTENLRIKLWTRNDKGFRGFLTGFVDAFDKHWNLILRDVDEQFVRKKVIKFPPLIKNSEREVSSDSKEKEAEVSLAFVRLQNYLTQNNETNHNYSSSSSSILPKKRKNTNNPMNYSQPEGVVRKSKTVFLGELNPLSICRTGLSELSLRDSNLPLQDSSENVGAPSVQKNISKSVLKSNSLTIFKTPFEDQFGFYVVAQTKKYELVQRHVGQVLLMGNDIVFIETKGC